jgi:hypothetical protein
MTINHNTVTIASSDTIDLSDFALGTNSTNNTMYYTTDTGTISTITLSPPANSYSMAPGESYWDSISTSFRNMKEFEDTMPSLTKVEEMCRMYPSLDKAFENFKAVYNLIKDDYEARKNNDS